MSDAIESIDSFRQRAEAWISEHGSLMTFNAPDQMPCADLLICKALSLTKQIKMGPGIRPLPFFHPLQVATDCAVCDHLSDGRYMAGFGLGLAITRAYLRALGGSLEYEPVAPHGSCFRLVLHRGPHLHLGPAHEWWLQS